MAAQTSFINSLLNAAFKGGTYTGGTIKIGLFKTGLPSTTGVEVSSPGYARQTITFSAPASKTIASSANIVFSNLSTSDTIIAWGVFDGTTLIDEGTLSSPFQADTTSNELDISYTFTLSA